MALAGISLPQVCEAIVTVKIGEALTDCRVSHGPSQPISFTVSDGYRVLKERLKRLFVESTDVMWPDDARIYAKTTMNASNEAIDHCQSTITSF